MTTVPITRPFAWGKGIVEDMCYERRRAEACVDESAHHAEVCVVGPIKRVCVFITAVPVIKLCFYY